MKKIYLTALALGTAFCANAQDTYLNDRMVNTASEIYGTARYVGMGGAMGALGADLSCMQSNPAGIGLYRRSDLSMTAGAQWNTEKVDGIKNARGTFDQLGFVWSSRTNNENMPFFNIGFNYQKKLNFGSGFVADNLNLKGLSQMDQLAELVNNGMGTDYNLAGAAAYYPFLTPVDANNTPVDDPVKDKDKIAGFRNDYNGEVGYYTHNQWGGLNSFAFNLSGNVNDRVYWGVTLDFESLKYRSNTDYSEQSFKVEDGVEKYGDYSLYNDRVIDGWGMNLKFGLIVRPFEEQSFRVGLALETPSWYQIQSSTLYQLYDEIDKIGYSDKPNQLDESYLEYALHNPVKGRLSMGSTVGSFFAWDVDYEFGNYGKTFMGYPRNINYDGSAGLFNNEPDREMNKHTKNTLGFQHTVRAGIEVKPTSSLALRLGYNFSSSPYKDNISFDQCYLDSYARDFMTSTNYMKVGAANTMTLGLGYKKKYFYIDLAYKVRAQKADFYHFDDSFNIDGDVLTDNNGNPVRLDPVTANLGRQQMTCTLGFKF